MGLVALLVSFFSVFCYSNSVFLFCGGSSFSAVNRSFVVALVFSVSVLFSVVVVVVVDLKALCALAVGVVTVPYSASLLELHNFDN